MAVYKHQYRQYEGELTSRWQRLLIPSRYAYRGIFQSKFFVVFFVLCFLVPVGGAVLIYLTHNLNAMEMLQIPPNALISIDADFFEGILTIQGSFAFLLTVFVGPGLVSPDLTNNALPLYLSRPFSKVDYVLGKMLVLLILQSCVTWAPLTILFFLQSTLQGGEWMAENSRILVASLVGAFIWILFLSLLALAVSAWVRWKAIGGALLFGVFFVAVGFAETINQTFTTRWGDLFNLNEVIRVIWSWLFHGMGLPIERINGVEVNSVPIWSAWLALAIICLICLALLSRRIRAYEVVR